MQTIEMRMIQIMCGMTLQKEIVDSVLKEWTGVKDIGDHFIRGHQLRWLGHLKRMNVE